MKLYGLEIDNLTESQVKENLRKIDSLQLLRIESLKNKLMTYQQSQCLFVPKSTMQ